MLRPSFTPTFPSPLSCGSGRQAVRFRVRLRGADPHPRRLPGPRCRRDVVPVSAAISDQRRPPQTIEARRDDPDSQALFETYDAEADLWAGEVVEVFIGTIDDQAEAQMTAEEEFEFFFGVSPAEALAALPAAPR